MTNWKESAEIFCREFGVEKIIYPDHRYRYDLTGLEHDSCIALFDETGFLVITVGDLSQTWGLGYFPDGIKSVPVAARNEYRAAIDPANLDFDKIEDALHDSILRIFDRDGSEYVQRLAEHIELDDSPETREAHKEVFDRVSRRPASFRVGMMMVHREIYEGLAQNVSHWLSDRPIFIDKYLTKAEQAYAMLVTKLKEDHSIIERHGAMFTIEFLIERENRRDNMFMDFFTSYPVYARQYIEKYAEKLIALAKEGVESPDLLREICRFQMFRCNMSVLRKGWGPQAGAGSQHDNENDHARLIDMTQNIIDKKRQRRAADQLSEEEMDELEDEC